MFQLKSCCFCFSLRIGSLLITIFYGLNGIAGFFDKGNDDYSILIGATLLTLSIIGLIGILKKIRWIILGFSIIHIIIFIVAIGLGIALFSGYDVNKVGHSKVVVYSEIILSLLYLYFAVILYSYYCELKKEQVSENREGNNKVFVTVSY